MSKKQRRKYKICPNCSTTLLEKDNFCSHCGQENHNLNVPFTHLVGEFVETIFHIDSKFWNTLKSILTPGKLTNEFIQGRRASYMPPARLYIMVSFLFFLALNFSLKNNINDTNQAEAVVTLFDNQIEFYGKEINISGEKIDLGNISKSTINRLLLNNGLDTTKLLIDSMRSLLEKKIVTRYPFEDDNDSAIYFDYQQLLALKNTNNFDSLLKSFNPSLELDYVERSIYKQALLGKEGGGRRFNINGQSMDTLLTLDDEVLKKFKYINDNSRLDSIIGSYKIVPNFFVRVIFRKIYDYKHFDSNRDLTAILNVFTKYLSYVMFLLMPIVAIILLVINYRWKRNYYEYFIFSIHTHSILFLFASIECLLRYTLKFDTTQPNLSLLGMFPYVLIALKNVYKQSWTKTIIKFIFLSTVYSFIFGITILVVLLYSTISY